MQPLVATVALQLMSLVLLAGLLWLPTLGLETVVEK